MTHYMVEIVLLLAAFGFFFIVIVSSSIGILLATQSEKAPMTEVSTGGSSVPPGQWIDTNITFFDDPSGFSGVDLYKYGKQSFNGKPVYPCAVHHDHAAEFLWSIVEVQGKGLHPVYLHVLDICNRADAPCTNKNKNGLNFLVDVHKTGWDAIGAVTGVIPGKVRKIGVVRPRDLPETVFLEGGDTYVMCSCTGDCSASSQQWKPIKDCS